MIKKIILAGLVAGSALYANVNLNTKQTNTQVNNNGYLNKGETVSILKLFPNSSQMIKKYKSGDLQVYIKEKNGFYIVMLKDKKGSANVFITKNKQFLIEGVIFNLKNQKMLSIHLPVNKKTVQNGVSMTFGHGKKVLYIVIDPECPYCKILHNNKKFMHYLSDNYKINVIIYPLPFHQNSQKMSEYILSGQSNIDKLKRLNQTFNGSNAYKYMHLTKAQKVKADEEIVNGKKAAMALSFKGTPNFFDGNFNSINPFALYQKAQKKNKDN